ncbi:MAG: glycosyltransferase family 2 protein [Gammaproteobacteria bacterium]|jgi:N-acetylglucosaminyl-diphospho-decaprenol L-rhamnosyltransferase|nr:glycosyltransferase family 2 protein [Gammaproteobacteria bacterium]
MKISIIIVTYNSGKHLDNAIQSINAQKYKNYNVIIIDNNSIEKDYIRKYNDRPQIELLFLNDNLGYCGGNNIGIEKSIDESDLLLIMNPDIVLPNTFCSDLISLTKELESQKLEFGIIGPKLLKFDSSNEYSLIDSTGIFQKWYGKWYDRGQMTVDDGRYDVELVEQIPAICGALMILNPRALTRVRLNNDEYFKNSFFMYKEDIELSLRMKSFGYGVFHVSDLVAYHHRGWQNRRTMSKRVKVMSARNELDINKTRGIIKMIYSAVKLLLAQIGI